MKTRSGFVSNSSSTSFCVIGTSSKEHIEQLAKAEGFWFDESNWALLSWGQEEGKVVTFYGSDHEAYVAGIDATKVLARRSIAKARKWFQLEVGTLLGVNIPLNEIDLYYGEAGSG